MPRRPPARWLVTGGRGSGKTRLGAEWVNGLVRGLPPFSKGEGYKHFALVGETLADVREVMIEGPSGILAASRGNRPRFEPSRRRLVWANGAVAHMFSSEDPESLRGPQFDAAWCDELGKWKNAEATFDMLQFGLRLGARPIQLITTTPRPTRLMKRLVADPAVACRKLSTAQNAGNLAAGFVEALTERYGGTRLGRQELDGDTQPFQDALQNLEKLSASFGSQLSGALRSAAVSGKDLDDILRRIGLNLAGLALQQGLKPLQTLAGGLFSSLFGGLAGLMPFARGGVPGHVTPFAAGGVVSAPSYFPLGRNVGVMGEAGPEAILPLQRSADGRLGVAAAGGGTGVNVVFNVTTPDASSFRKSEAQVTGMLARAVSREPALFRSRDV